MKVKIRNINKPWYYTIKHLSRDLNYRQIDLAKDAGCSQACLSNYLNGKVGTKDPALIRRIKHCVIYYQFTSQNRQGV